MLLNGHEDCVDLELPDIGSAKRESARAVGELLAERDRAVWEHGKIAVVVDDEDGNEVLSMHVLAAEQQL
jgi:hypothetical protein